MNSWTSPTKGKLSMMEIINEIIEYVRQDLNDSYEVRIGTDSQKHGRSYVFVTSIILRRVGKGARFFYKKEYRPSRISIEERMWAEAVLSLDYARELASEILNEKIPGDVRMCLDLDLGVNGETKKFVKAITGMVSSYGFSTDIKPYSYAASCVADKYAR